MNRVTARYIELLENFMDTVSAVVVEQGQEAPTFHIFSETQEPCPPTETGAFLEFPAWPVERDQVLISMDRTADQRATCASIDIGAT